MPTLLQEPQESSMLARPLPLSDLVPEDRSDFLVFEAVDGCRDDPTSKLRAVPIRWPADVVCGSVTNLCSSYS